MRIILLLAMCFVMFVSVAQGGLIQHLDATQANSIIISSTPSYDPGDPNKVIGYKVTEWRDLSGAANNAVAIGTGVVTYPSLFDFSGGFAGCKFAQVITQGTPPAPVTAASKMQLFTAVLSDNFLDFTPGTGKAAGKSGVTILVAAKDNSASPHATWSDILANKAGGGVGFYMRYNDPAGDLNFQFQDGNETKTLSQAAVYAPGQSAVYAFRFDAGSTSNNLTMSWAASNGSKGEKSTSLLTPGDYSSANQPVSIGVADNASRYFDGAIGEVMIYDEALSVADYQYQVDRLERKWVKSRAVAPLDGSEVIATSTLSLNWLNLLPVVQGGDVTVDVWFGTEPNRPQMTLVANDALNLAATIVNASTAGETYYWAIDTRIGSGSVAIGEPNTIEGPFYSFTSVADPAPESIDAGSNYITWPGQGVPVTAMVSDGGVANVTVTFTSTDPNMVFNPNPVVVAGGGVPKTTFPVSTTATTDWDSPGNVTVTATAEDAYPDNAGKTVSDTMLITVYGTACAATRQGVGITFATDLVPDCVRDLADLAVLAADWLKGYALTEAYKVQ